MKDWEAYDNEQKRCIEEAEGPNWRNHHGIESGNDGTGFQHECRLCNKKLTDYKIVRDHIGTENHKKKNVVESLCRRSLEGRSPGDARLRIR